MITVFIVDDEKMTRKSIHELIPWQELGVDRVETANNGLTALELAARVKPDIVLTDVRMPKMDGMELTRKLKEIYPDCKTIFISGYSDKEYLKSAIHLNALSYIEKPLNLEEIKLVVRNTVAFCLEEERKRMDQESLKNSLHESIPLLRQEIARELVKVNTDIKMLMYKYHTSLISMPWEGPFTITCMMMNYKSGLDCSIKNEINAKVLILLCSDDTGLPSPTIAGFIENDLLVSISPGDIQNPEAVLRPLLGILTGISGGQLAVSIGIGPPAKTLHSIPDAYHTAVECVKLQFYDGCEKIFRCNTCRTQFFPNKSLYASFRDAMKEDTGENASRIVRELSEDVRTARDRDIENIKNIYFKLLLIALEVSREIGPMDDAEEDAQNYVWQEIDRIRYLSELSSYLTNNIKAIFSRPNQEDDMTIKIYEINRYIREHISDKNLSVSTISSNIYLSQAYLCTYYKKITGKTINEYVTETRIERAKELLRNSGYTLIDIAGQIGLTDRNYVSALFKKYTGCTPTEYRRKIQP